MLSQIKYMHVLSRNSSTLKVVLIILISSSLLAGCMDGRFEPSGWDGFTVSSDTLYACSDGQFLALNLSDQATIRNFTPEGGDQGSSSFFGCTGSSAPKLTSYSAPVISGSTFYTGTYIGEVHARDAITGARKWEPYDTGKQIVGGPAIKGNSLIVAAGDKLYKLNTDTGKPALNWEEPFDAGGKIWCTPVISGSTVYFGDLNHEVYAVDLATKEEVWKQGFAGAIASTPLIVDDTLYIGTLDNKFYAMDITNGGELVWDEPFETDNWVWTQAVHHEGTLYFGSFGGSVYAIDADTGKMNPEWVSPYITESGDRIRAKPAIVGDVLVIGSQDDSIYGLKLQDGMEAWAPLHFEDDIMADPYYSGIGTTVYFMDKDDVIHAINAELGNQIWYKHLEIE